MRSLMILAALCAGAHGASAAELEGRVTAIHDGDTLTLSTGRGELRIRLDGVDAPEPGQPFARSARRSLSALCARKEAKVVERGKDDEGRILGSVTCGEVDVNAEQVRRGFAWVHLRYLPLGSPLYEFEANARLRKLGLWRGRTPPVPPWEWRARASRQDAKR